MKADWGNRIFFSFELSGFDCEPSKVEDLLGVEASFSKPATERRPNLWVLKSAYFLAEDDIEPEKFARVLARVSRNGLKRLQKSGKVAFYCVVETTDRNYEYEIPKFILKEIVRLDLNLKIDFFIFTKASVKRVREA